MNQEKIGELLKTLRKKNGKTQEEVARDLYVSQKTISRWESGVSKGGNAPIWHTTLRSKV